MRHLFLAYAVLLVVLVPAPARSGSFDGKPKILLHTVQVPTSKVADRCSYGALADCAAAATSGVLSTSTGPYYWTYVLAARGNLASVNGFQVGIEYDSGAATDDRDGKGIDIFEWTLCGLFESITPGEHSWPRPGSGSQILWDFMGTHPERCATGPVAVGGYFYMGAYSPDVLRLTPRPADHAAWMADCSGHQVAMDPNQDLGFVRFSENGTEPGCNPCVENCLFEGVPVEPATWSTIKALSRDAR